MSCCAYQRGGELVRSFLLCDQPHIIQGPSEFQDHCRRPNSAPVSCWGLHGVLHVHWHAVGERT